MQQNSHAIHRKITLSTVLASDLNYSASALRSSVYSAPALVILPLYVLEQNI